MMSPPKPDMASKTNLELLNEFFDAKRIFALPWLGKGFDARRPLKNLRVQETLHALMK